MRRFGWTISSGLAAGLVAAGMLSPMNLLAQATATIKGHVQNAVGQPVTKGDVKLTTDKTSDPKTRKFQYDFPLDGGGNYTGSVAPGDYLAVVFQDDKSLDFIDSVVIKAGDAKVVDFDMTREEYIKTLTPEQKKDIEEFKKKNAEAVNANAKIANLNAALIQARTDTKAGNFDAAITSMTQATQQKPDEAILWVALGDAQLGKGDAVAKTSGKQDPTAQQDYKDATASYKKAVDANAASKKPNPETAAAADNQIGQALAKGGDAKGASDAYDAAAKADPAKSGMYLFNEAATLYNAGKTEEAAAAADKAIAADPKRADAYYIKGQSLIQKATVDEKTKKVVAPPGCVEAYQTYLELAPDGPHAEDVKQVLTGIGAPVKSSYRAGKKS